MDTESSQGKGDERTLVKSARLGGDYARIRPLASQPPRRKGAGMLESAPGGSKRDSHNSNARDVAPGWASAPASIASD